jgi:hypothetical protein
MQRAAIGKTPRQYSLCVSSIDAKEHRSCGPANFTNAVTTQGAPPSFRLGTAPPVHMGHQPPEEGEADGPGHYGATAVRRELRVRRSTWRRKQQTHTSRLLRGMRIIGGWYLLETPSHLT